MQEKNVPSVTPVPTSWTGICLQYLHPKKHFLQCSTQICNSYKYQKNSIEATKFRTTPHSDVVLPNPQYLYDNAKCSWMEFALLRLSGVAGQVLPFGTTWQAQQSIHRCCQDAIGEATQNQEESDLACEELWMKVVNYDLFDLVRRHLLLPWQRARETAFAAWLSAQCCEYWCLHSPKTFETRNLTKWDNSKRSYFRTVL